MILHTMKKSQSLKKNRPVKKSALFHDLRKKKLISFTGRFAGLKKSPGFAKTKQNNQNKPNNLMKHE